MGRGWRYHVTARVEGWQDDDTPEGIREEMRELAKQLRAHKCFELCEALEDDTFDELDSTPDRFVQDAANSIVSDIYDYADDVRIWLTIEGKAKED